MNTDRVRNLAALLGLRHILVLDPFQAMAGDVPARFFHGGNHFRVPFQRGRNAEHSGRNSALGENPPEPPEAGARAILEHRFDIGMALPGPWLRTQYIGQERFGRTVAMQDVVFAAFLEVDHELYRDTRVARPMRVGRVAPVATEIARIIRVSHRTAPPR